MDRGLEIEPGDAPYRGVLPGWPLALKVLLAVAWTAGICAIPFATDPRVLEAASNLLL